MSRSKKAFIRHILALFNRCSFVHKLSLSSCVSTNVCMHVYTNVWTRDPCKQIQVNIGAYTSITQLTFLFVLSCSYEHIQPHTPFRQELLETFALFDHDGRFRQTHFFSTSRYVCWMKKPSTLHLFTYAHSIAFESLLRRGDWYGGTL